MKKIKIEIKNRFTGKIIFEYESKDNTIKKTVLKAIDNNADLSDANLSGADLSDADLSGANLSRANLSGADLSDADLSGVYLSDANLSRANLSRANLSRADLSDANLSGANLSGADLSDAYLFDNHKNKIIIKKAIVFTGLYMYLSMPIIDENNKEYIKLGCHTRSIKDWNKDFWNNNDEFPNDNSIKSNLRVFAYKTCKKWLKLNRESL